MTACLPKASDAGNVPLLGEQSKSQMSTSVRLSGKVAEVTRKAVSAQAAQRWVQLAQQFDPARVALCVNIVVHVIGVDDRADPLELVDHLVNATREQQQLNIVDKQQRQFVNKQARVMAAQIGSVLMA